MSSLTERARGRWRHMLPLLAGIDPKTLRNKQGPCPMCGGKDRFRWDDKDGKGTYYCNQCGSGDGFLLLMKLKGIDFPEAARRVEEVVGKAPVDMRQEQKRSEAETRAMLDRMWAGGDPVSYGDPVSCYLRNRGIDLETVPESLRYVDRCRYHRDGEAPQYFPAMLAKVTDPSGQLVTLHRTYLSGKGGKADVPAPRRLAQGRIVNGASVALGGVRERLGVAEGIETALSAGILYSLPVWAATNSSLLMKWEPPPGVKEVVVFGDNDPAFGGQSAAYALAHRLAVGGLQVSVKVPVASGCDWNDRLREVA